MDSRDFLFVRTSDKPKIRRILIILEPIIAPIAMSDSFLLKALSVTNNSGRDVPNPIINIPVINAGILSLFKSIIEFALLNLKSLFTL